MAKLVSLIETNDRRGTGTAKDPYRLVKQLFATDGTLVMEDDAARNDDGLCWSALMSELANYGPYDHGKTLRGNLVLLQQLVERWELEEGDHA